MSALALEVKSHRPPLAVPHRHEQLRFGDVEQLLPDVLHRRPESAILLDPAIEGAPVDVRRLAGWADEAGLDQKVKRRGPSSPRIPVLRFSHLSHLSIKSSWITRFPRTKRERI
jgi:hypothetical protein